QRNRLALRRFIKPHRLLNSVVLDDEVLGFEPVHDSAPLVFHQCRNQHHVGLGTENGFLRGSAGKQRQEHKERCRAPQTSPPCGCRPVLHPAHLLIDAPASGSRLPRRRAFCGPDDIHRRYSERPEPPAAPCRWYSWPRLQPASCRPRIRPASECTPGPTHAGCRLDRKSPPARPPAAPHSAPDLWSL